MLYSAVGVLADQWVVNRYRATARKIDWRHMWPALLLFAALVVQLWVRIVIVERGYELESLRKETLENDARLRQLRVEQALLSRPQRILEKAQSELGLATTAPQQMRRVEIAETVRSGSR